MPEPTSAEGATTWTPDRLGSGWEDFTIHLEELAKLSIPQQAAALHAVASCLPPAEAVIPWRLEEWKK